MRKPAATDRPYLQSLSHSFTLDLVILHEDRTVVERCQAVVSEWLREMGLALKPSKTRITHTLEVAEGTPGFDFLGVQIRQYPVGETKSGKDCRGRLHGFK